MLRKRETDLRLCSESCLFRDSYGLARFFPSPGLNDLARASSRELGDVLRFFDARGDFDLVILDLGSECGGHASELISLCDALVLVEDASPGDVGKRDRAEAFAREALRPGGANPLFVENMRRFRYGADDDCDGNDGNSGGAGTTGDGFGTDAASADGMDRITIGCDDASFRDFDGMRDFVLSGELGIGIRRLSDILFARVCE
jgi:hypothetical protein